MKFEEVYKSTFQYVYRFFYYKSVNPAEIEDLIHETYIRFYTKYSDQNLDVTDCKRLLFAFSNNIYKEWVRKKIKEGRVELIDNYDYEDMYEDFCDDEYKKNLEIKKQKIKEFLPNLNEKVRLVLEYRFLNGMTRREVAEKLQMKEKDVHTYQKRGIKYLDKLINN